MEIIQQKLVWLMGSGAALILLYKLNLRRAGINGSALTRFRIGFGLIAAGSIAGIVSKIGLSTGLFSQSWQAYVLETIVGYVIGWSFLVLGAVRWAKEYFDQKGKPLVTVNARSISEKVSASLVKGHHHNQLLGALADNVKEVLSCQAISLHKTTDDGGLRLVYESGLTSESKDLISIPLDNAHMFWKCKNAGRAVLSDKDLVFGDGFRLMSEAGPLFAAMSLPVEFENKTLGVLTLYRSGVLLFDDDDVKLMEIVCDSLGISLENDNAEKRYNLVSRYREMLIMAVKPFENGEALVSALIKSAKIVHGYIPFRKISLYVHGSGKPYEIDFNLSTGGVVSVKSGFFPRAKYPEFNDGFDMAGRFKSGSRGMILDSEQKNFIFTVSGAKNPLAHLRIDLAEPAGKASYLPLLGAALGQKIGQRLEVELLEKMRERTEQLFGALQYYQEKSLSAVNLSGFLKELASLVVDLAPVTFCRIIFADARREYFKTIGLAQVRDLVWPEKDSSKVKLQDTALHRKALLGRTNLYFRLEGGDNTPTEDEKNLLFPDGIKHGMIVPLMVGDTPVGSLTVGESRNINRSSLNGESALLVTSIASLISMVLTWHKDRRTGDLLKEGRKSLMLRKKEQFADSALIDPGPNFRSRINGPLAGILASCEYLQTRTRDDRVDVDRFIEVIQRNAARIHEITMEKSEQGRAIMAK